MGVGSSRQLIFAERTTSGYRWFFEGCLPAVGVTDRVVVSHQPGGNARRLFSLTARTAGHSLLTFSLARIWEQDRKIAVVRVDVHASP